MTQAADIQPIAAIDARELVKGVYGERAVISESCARRQGVLFTLRDGNDSLGFLQIGVFSDKQTPRDMLKVLRLDQMRVLREEDVSGEIGEKGILQEARLFFQRENVLVCVWSPEETIKSVALAIDRALLSGNNCVVRRERVPAPRILKVEMPNKIFTGDMVPIKVHVDSPKSSRGDIGVCEWPSGIANVSSVPPQGVEVVYTVTYYAPRRIEGLRVQKDFWLCYATRGCAVTSQKVTLNIVPNKREDAARPMSRQRHRPEINRDN